MKARVISVVPIKLNNERLANKNIRFLGDKPLMQYIQSTLTQIPLIDKRFVYCSNSKICDYLMDGVIYLPRPVYLDEKKTNFSQIFEAFYAEIEADIYVYAHATAPFVQSNTIIDCIEKVLSGDYDSAFTAIRIQDFLWKDGKALNFDTENIPRSQDLDVIYRETNGVYVFRREVFGQYHRRVGVHPYIKEVGYREAVDINTSEDFEYAEKLL